MKTIIYTRSKSKYTIDHNMHMVTGENINPIYYYGEPNILLGFPAHFQTDRGVWKTSAIVKIEEGPKDHTYKLFSSTDKQLENFETRYAYSHFREEPVAIERPMQISNGSDLTEGKVVFQTVGSDIQITMYPRKIERGAFYIPTQFGEAVVYGMKVYTAHHTHIFYEGYVFFA